MPYIKKNYTKFRMIGYEIPTAKSHTNLGAEYNGTYTIANYPNIPNTIEDDARIRLKRLAGVVDTAYGLFRGKTPADTLNIFMAPEFYFRPETGGHARSYSEGTKKAIVTALRTMFANPVFEHWLFVAGTIVWDQRVVSYRDDGSSGSLHPLTRNTAVVIKGGHAEAPYALANKLNYASDDLPDKGAQKYGPLGEDQPVRVRDIMGSLEERSKAIFEIDNLWFGVEICRDHSSRLHVLKSTLLEWAERIDNSVELTFHLLPACGMPAESSSVAAATGGYLLREDGYVWNPYKPYSAVSQVTNQSYMDIKSLDTVIRGRTQWLDEDFDNRLDTDGYSRTTVAALEPAGGCPYTLALAKFSNELYMPVGDDVEKIHPQRLVWSDKLALPNLSTDKKVAN